MRKGCLVFRVTCLVKWSKTIHIKSRTLVQWLSEYRLIHSITYKRLMIEASSENQKQAIKTSLIYLALSPPNLPEHEYCQLCRWGESGIFPNMSSIKGREGVERPQLCVGILKVLEQQRE